MDRIIKFKGELEDKTTKQLERLKKKYINYFSDSFCKYYNINKKTLKELSLGERKELEFELFDFTFFLCMPDEETYKRVGNFIREEDFQNYFKIMQILLDGVIEKEINQFIDIKDVNI